MKYQSEQISKFVLYIISGIIVLVLLAYYFIGYDNVYEDNPELNDPLCTDVLIYLMYILVVAAVATAVAAIIRSFKMRDSSSDTAGIKSSVIANASFILMFVSLAVCFLVGSSKPVTVNGALLTDKFWLKVTDMFLSSSYFLLAVAVIGLVFGVSGINRKFPKKHK